MLVLFVVVSCAPLVPAAIRPSGEAIGGGNALGFTLLEAWFVAVIVALRRPRQSGGGSPSGPVIAWKA